MSHAYQQDNDWLLEWRQGNEKAFKAFYDKYVHALLTETFGKTKSWEASEEIVQDGFVKLYLNSQNISDNPYAYLRTILKNKIIDFYRASLHRQISVVSMEENTEQVNDPSLHLQYKELHSEIDKHIASLPPQCSRIFKMSREEGLSNKEIAAQLGISVKAVEAQITKALALMRDKLGYRLIIAIAVGYMLK